ncbi:FAD-binding domain-containing protein [Mycena venus]|uniref:FAD-binding domain-containing protein n=1 Tax=Mycena venus TaxID=2733690 RepID=A0A8H6XDI2_9AGAR|nr:FAD-binding domain-containing protein [Mycena venus]
MRPSFSAFLLLVFLSSSCQARSKCRNVPGSAGFPHASEWHALNASVSGRLVPVVPSAMYCASLPGGACTDAQWTSALFRNSIPGALNQVNFEQGYDLTPPSLCLRNSTTCGQGNVPLYSVEAETVKDVQAAVTFAATHDLRLVVKSSGHDYLGRSTAPVALLVHMAKFTDVAFTDAFVVGGQNMGSAVTVGPGVHMNDIYQETKANGKIVVGGTAATVCAAGGYLQGAGHSSLAPLFGLAADNVLEFQVVVASGELLTVNSISNPDLFFALRGGGAGSWGVIVAATVRTFPTFNVTKSVIELGALTNTAAAALARVHAEHIFDLDPVQGGQYYYLEKPGNTSVLMVETITANTTLEQGMALLTPFMNDALAVPDVFLISKDFATMGVNDALFHADDSVGANLVIGSRLIPAAAYEAPNGPATVAKVYQELLDGGARIILGNLVAGGQVSRNANISSAVHPAWRTAKTHLILGSGWDDSTSLPEINTLRKWFQTDQVAVLEQLSGPDAGSYSNEADIFEPKFQTTFYGPNYSKLSAIKSKYDPLDLFIVASGVGSERWDEWGLCTV